MYYEEEQVGLFDQDGWCGRMSPEHSRQTEEKISQRSSKKSSKSASLMPVCKCVSRINDGLNPGVTILRMDDGPLLGEYTMPSFGECPKEENASRLSQILEDSPRPRYSLSAKACRGILNRAERRGKERPAELLSALTEQARSQEHLMPTTETVPESGGAGANLPNAISFQERAGKPGGGKGILIQPERTGALSTLNNQRGLRCTGFDAYNQASTGDVSMSLTAIRADPHHVPCVEVEQTNAFNIGGYYSKAWPGHNPHAGIYATDVSRTLDSANCGSPAANQGGTAIVEIVNER